MVVVVLVVLLRIRHPRPDLSSAAESLTAMATPDRTHPVKVAVHRAQIRTDHRYLLLSIVDRFDLWHIRILEFTGEFIRLRLIFLLVDQREGIGFQLIFRGEDDKWLEIRNVFLVESSQWKVGDDISR